MCSVTWPMCMASTKDSPQPAARVIYVLAGMGCDVFEGRQAGAREYGLPGLRLGAMGTESAMRYLRMVHVDQIISLQENES